ncbi:MAG: hypothetical protein Q8R57_16850, partial [Bacteroidota bacterium]|nr:hypothetical protein [Bacteroidota bacterium]
MKQRLFILLLLGLFFTPSLNASHVLGFEITYNKVAPKVYKINVVVYRDCEHVQLCNCSLLSNCSIIATVSGGVLPLNLSHNVNSPASFSTENFFTQPLPLNATKPVIEINEMMGGAKSVCTLCSNRTPGTYSPGIEAYTFSGNIDLNSISPSCCWVDVSFSISTRAQGITTLQGYNFNRFTNIQINVCENGPNTSPTFSNLPRALTCVYNDFFYKIDAHDADGDSLSYRLGDIRGNKLTLVPYFTPFSKMAPVPYLGFPSTNPSFQPPLGFHLNANTGLVQFRPTTAFWAPLIFEVLKWRRINGVPTLMGIVAREMDHRAFPCYGTLPSVAIYDMKGNALLGNEIRICESNETCVIVAGKDGLNTDDTTTLEFSNNPGMSVFPFYNPATRRTVGPIHDSVKVCMNYQPSGNQTFQAFAFSMVSRDKTMPINMSAQKSFRVIIMSAPKVRLLASSTGNMGRKIYLGRLNTIPFNAGLTNWNIENFPGSNSFSTFTAKDTVSFTFSGGGWY